MTTLTAAQLTPYVAKAGFKGNGAVSAIAVALAESGGRTDAVNVNHDKWKSRDRGLWQINSHWHPEVSDAAAFDPTQAAAAAYRISKSGKDFSAWSTWPAVAAIYFPAASLGIQQYLQGLANGAIGEPFTLNPVTAVKDGTVSLPGLDTAHAIEQLVVLVGHAGIWVADPHNWLRIVMVTAGAAGLVVALVLLAESGAAGSTAQSAARTTTKAASVAALA